MTNRVAQDDEGRPVQVMALGEALTVAIASTSTRSTELSGGDRTGAFVSIYATAGCYLAVGDDTIEATTDDHYIEPGARRDFYVPAATLYLAVIRESGDGELRVSTLDGTR